VDENGQLALGEAEGLGRGREEDAIDALQLDEVVAGAGGAELAGAALVRASGDPRRVGAGQAALRLGALDLVLAADATGSTSRWSPRQRVAGGGARRQGGHGPVGGARLHGFGELPTPWRRWTGCARPRRRARSAGERRPAADEERYGMTRSRVTGRIGLRALVAAGRAFPLRMAVRGSAVPTGALLLAPIGRTATTLPSGRRAVHSFHGSRSRFFEWLRRSPSGS
jgi:hypothetical protein